MKRELLQPVQSKASGGVIPFIILIFIAFAFIIYFSAVPGGSSSLITFALICAISVVLAFIDSRYLIQYLLWVWVTAPGVRRLLDYLQENYQAVSPLVVAALAASLTTLIPIFRRKVKLDLRIIRALGLTILAIIYASILGLFRNGMPALYDIANIAIPLLMLVYMSIQKLDSNAKDAHIRSFVTMAVFVAIYGWIQFLFVPLWDAYWVNHSGMGSLGAARPLMLRIFSTLNAPSSAADLFGVALIPMLTVPKWRGIFGWFGVILVGGALAFTMVRSAWIVLVLGILTFILMGTGKQRWVSAFRIVFAVAIAAILFPLIPGMRAISNRAETLTNLKQDQSYKARLEGTFSALQQFVKQPLGRGLGSIGESSKIGVNDEDKSSAIFTDNGIVVLLNTYGLLGSVSLFSGIWILFKTLLSANATHPENQNYTKLGLALYSSYVGSLIFGNTLQGISAAFLWYFTGIALAKPPDLTTPSKANSTMRLSVLPREGRS